MSHGVPGYDFGEREVVTADKLRRWLENARWEDVCASDVAYDFGQFFFAWTAPTDASEGAIWYSPASAHVHVNTRWGWTRIFMPTGWESRRLRPFANMFDLGPQLVACIPQNYASLTAESACFQEAGTGQYLKAHYYLPDSMSGVTLVLTDHPAVRPFGVTPIYWPGAPGPIASRRTYQVSNGLPVAVTETTAATTSLDLSYGIFLTLLGCSFAPDVPGVLRSAFFTGLPIQYFRDDGL